MATISFFDRVIDIFKSTPLGGGEYARRERDAILRQISELRQDKDFNEVYMEKDMKFIPRWKQALAVSIAECNDCIVARGKGLAFLGHSADVAFSVSTYRYFAGLIASACSEYERGLGYTKYNAKIGDAFKSGAVSALQTRMHNSSESRIRAIDDGAVVVALKRQVVLDHYADVNLVTDKHFGRPTDTPSYSAFEEGFRLGHEVALTRWVSRERH